jgi:hypothetical protein
VFAYISAAGLPASKMPPPPTHPYSTYVTPLYNQLSMFKKKIRALRPRHRARRFRHYDITDVVEFYLNLIIERCGVRGWVG